MDLNHLEVFTKVYEERSFSKAATALYLTQPTVSAHISSLEKELNISLFNRTTKQVIPTQSSDRLYKYAIDMLSTRDTIFKEFNAFTNKTIKINIGASTIPSRFILPNLISGFKKHNSNIEVNIITSNSMEIIKKLMKKDINIGFIGKKYNLNGITSTPFFTDNIVFIMPLTEKYKRIIRCKSPISALLACPIILRQTSEITTDAKKGDEFLKKIGYTDDKLNIVSRNDDQDEIYKLVLEKNAVSLFSKVAAMEYKKNNKILVYNPISFPMKRNLYRITRNNETLLDIENKLIDFTQIL